MLGHHLARHAVELPALQHVAGAPRGIEPRQHLIARLAHSGKDLGVRRWHVQPGKGDPSDVAKHVLLAGMARPQVDEDPSTRLNGRGRVGLRFVVRIAAVAIDADDRRMPDVEAAPLQLGDDESLNVEFGEAGVEPVAYIIKGRVLDCGHLAAGVAVRGERVRAPRGQGDLAQIGRRDHLGAEGSHQI